MNMKALKLQIQGKVQGVGYRRWFEQQAIVLDLKGYVKNLENGDVEAVVLGLDINVRSILKLCYTGPAQAEVATVLQSEMTLDEANFTDFKIQR